MSVQFGRWNWEGQLPASDYIERVGMTLAPYGPDSNEAYSKGGVNILYRAFHTTNESHREKQPHVSRTGAVITWDGRLDNRTDLLVELGGSLTARSTDVEIVAMTYETLGVNCLAKLIGDWALSIWNPKDRLLTLAKDPIGTRHLYYSVEDHQVTWSTILDPLVLFAGRSFEICEAYIAGWLGCFPAPHLTPYIGIHSVPPSSAVLLRPDKHGAKHSISKYWDFDPGKRIRYHTDAQYEEHFRTIFAQAVRSRLRSDRPVLAELSGGMDSSAIVCMADVIISTGEAETSRLDTISYYDDSKPSLDERPYFTKVEQKRGRTGYHIDLGAKIEPEMREGDPRQSWLSGFEDDRLAATPNYNRNLWPELYESYSLYRRSDQYRVTLSGIAGEDATGGYVPTPTPELQNLLVGARLITLARQLDAWATRMGKSWLFLLWKALRGFCTHSITFPGPPGDMCPPPWLQSEFVRRNYAALHWYPSKLKLFGGLPSFQNQIHLLNHERRVLASIDLRSEVLREIRYPFLDRDLLEFACAIPREQIVGVGKRRFLMKRALIGIVPDELLNRKMRASVTQERQKDTSKEWLSWGEMGHDILCSSLGIVDPERLLQALEIARRNGEFTIDGLKRTLVVELWLRHLANQKIVTMTPQSAKTPLGYSSVEVEALPAPVRADKFS